MGDTFPEVRAKAAEIEQVLAEEEASFTRTLRKGIDRFHKARLPPLRRTFLG